MSTVLKEGQAVTQASTVGQVFHVWGGGTPATSVAKYWNGQIPWVTSADLDDDFGIHYRKSITDEAVASSATHVVQKDSILVATRVGLGKVGIATGPTAYSQDCQGLTPKTGDVVTRFAAYQLKLRTQEFKHIARGTTIAGVTKRQLLETSFILPAVSHQQSISDRLDLQFSRLDAAVAALKRAQANLKRYRASVLQAAVTGRLVPTEHELATAEGRDYETGEQLLERILAERRRTWSGKGKYKEPTASDDLLQQDVLGWGWSSFDQIADLQLGYMLDKAKRTEGSVLPYLRNVNVRWGKFDLSSVLTVAIKELGIERYTVQTGDLLVCEGGEPGRSAVWVETGRRMAFQKALHRIRPYAGIDPRFVQFFLEDVAHRGKLAHRFTGSTIKHLTKESLKIVGVPLPPLSEQARIVAEVERRLSVADQLEATLESNLRRATRLRQAILKKAFTFPETEAAS